MIDQAIIKLIALLIWVIGWTIYGIFGNPLVISWADTFWMSCLNAGFLVLFIAMAWLPVKYEKLNKKVEIIGFLFALSNMVDFLSPWGSAFKFQWNEYIFALLTIIIVARGRRKRKPVADFKHFFGVTQSKKLEKVPAGDDNNISGDPVEGDSQHS